MESQSYGDFSLDLHQRLISRRIPVEGTIEVTRRCPMTCVHCYNNLPLNDLREQSEELSCSEHCRILDEITEAGCLWLLYTGGEIFARKDFLDIYTHAKKKGLLITLFTNGTLITPDISDHLARWAPFAIEISIYGRTSETHDGVTGAPGSFEKCLRGIQLLRERNLPLKIKTVVLTSNKHEMPDMKRFVEQDLGLQFRFDYMVNPRIDCSRVPLSVRLPPSEAIGLDLDDPARIAEWRRFAGEFTGPRQVSAAGDELYQCGAGVSSFAISPEGKLSLCVLDQEDSYDLRRGSFSEGWENHLRRVRSRKATRQTRCAACEIQAMCGMCPANGRLEREDAESPVDFLCYVAHLRSYALDIPVPAHGDCAFCDGGSDYAELKHMANRLKQGRSHDERTVEV